MDAERLLLSKTAQTGRIQPLLSLGINEDHFDEEESKLIFRFMVDHAKGYRQPPSFSTVREHFPDHNFEITDESFDFLVERFLLEVKKRFSVDAIRDLADIVDNPEQLKDIDVHFLEKSRELTNILPISKLHRFSDMDKRIEEYEHEKEHPELDKSIKMGIPALDNLTLGIQPHEYATIMGWSGTGKSTLAQWMFFNAWSAGKTPMYFSLEMEKKALYRKWDTMATHFETQNLKSHNLTDKEMEVWREKANYVKDHPGDILVMDDIRRLNIDRVYAELVRWSPDIACIDYITLMDLPKSAGKNSWEKVQYLTNNLKQISRTLKIPIIGVAQTNRASADVGAELDNVAFGLSIIQDSDLVLGLYRNDEMKENNQMRVKMLKNRDGMTASTDLWWKMSDMSFGPWDEMATFRNRPLNVES